MPIIEIICLSLVVILISIFAEKWYNRISNKDNKISFKEAMDLTDLPVITLRQGDKRINLLLDTGSTKSIILPSVLETFEYVTTGEVGTVYGMEGNIVETHYINMDFMYNYITYNETFQVVDMSAAFNSIKVTSGVSIHGILGNSFFERYGYIIDFQKFIAYGKNNKSNFQIWGE